MDVTIVIATFGSSAWVERAARVAIPSARAQTSCVIPFHGDTLAQARNSGAALAKTDWLCFLDADDELEPGYIDAMQRASLTCTDAHPLLAPRVRWDGPTGVLGQAVSLAARDIDRMNPCVIGSLVRRERFTEVGGFDERDCAYEDWSMFRRCWLLGSPVVHVDGAVYQAHSGPTGRNSIVRNPQQLIADIRRRNAEWLASRG